MQADQDSNVLLLIEDNPADVDLTRESFETGQSGLSIKVASDGVEALNYLKREDEFHDAVRPQLIMLDLNLPRLDGREVLRFIKSSSILRRIPIIVMSSSTARKDISESYDLGASCYLTKPLDLHAYRDMVNIVERFWFEVASLPRGSELSGPA